MYLSIIYLYLSTYLSTYLPSICLSSTYMFISLLHSLVGADLARWCVLPYLVPSSLLKVCATFLVLRNRHHLFSLQSGQGPGTHRLQNEILSLGEVFSWKFLAVPSLASSTTDYYWSYSSNGCLFLQVNFWLVLTCFLKLKKATASLFQRNFNLGLGYI